MALLASPSGALAQAKPLANDQSITLLQGVGFGSLHQPVTPVDAAHPLPVDTVVKIIATDRGAIVGTTAVTLMPANPARRGFAIQNQSTSASCYISGQATATTDYHSLLIGPAGYYDTPPTYAGTGAISIVCTAAGTSVYAREW